MPEPPAPAPAPEEVWEEILLRLPPDDPASLLRASLACKQWRRIVSRRGFLRRLAQLHGAPPMLGFFNKTGTFVPTTAGRGFSLPVPERRTWPKLLDCRHGRALLVDASMEVLLVWEPTTGYRRRVPLPAAVVASWDSFNAAVVCACAVDGCRHWSCHGRPFRVVIWASHCSDPFVSDFEYSAWEYSSETSSWGDPTPIRFIYDNTEAMSWDPSLLVGNHVYFCCGSWEIIKYDLGGQDLAATVIHIEVTDTNVRWFSLIEVEDGCLGAAGVKGSCLHLWSPRMSGDTDGDADAGWVLRRTIHLQNLLPAAALSDSAAFVGVIGFAEGVNVVFLSTGDGIFTIDLKSGRARRVCQTNKYPSPLIPFVSFYAPSIQDDAEEQG